MIVYDPSPEANGTRGLASDALVEMIDLAPTFLDFLEADAKPHILEGRSLIPLLRGEAAHPWRPVAISEYNYAFDRARQRLRTPALASMLYMVTDGHWKLVHADGFRPMLFDLRADPQELRARKIGHVVVNSVAHHAVWIAAVLFLISLAGWSLTDVLEQTALSEPLSPPVLTRT
jgi:arylsulfatase A-like enzyme